MCPIPRKAGFITPCFPLKEEEPPVTEKENSVTYNLKVRSNATGAQIQTYKRILRRFEEGTPEAFIKTIQGFNEIWTQNQVTQANDMEATVKTVLRGASLSQFEARLTELTTSTDANGNAMTSDATPAQVQEALNEVGRNVFPHRALENQKQWMRRHLKKPSDMPFRKMASSVVRINSYLPFLPNATENDKFSEVEVVELLEFSLPASWRAKFDLEGFVPTANTRQELVKKCEALERSLPETPKQTPAKGKKTTAKYKPGNGNGNNHRNGKGNGTQKYCALHGKGTHSTEECKTLKAQREAKRNNKPFTPANFRKEVNAMNKKSKKKALDSFAAVIKAERKKLNKKKKVADSDTNSSDSESEASLGNIEPKQRTVYRLKKVAFTKKAKKAKKAKHPVKPKAKKPPSEKSVLKSLSALSIDPKLKGMIEKSVDPEPSEKIEPNSPELPILTAKDLKKSNAENEKKAKESAAKLHAKIDSNKKIDEIFDNLEDEDSTMEAEIDEKATFADPAGETDDLTERLKHLGEPLTDETAEQAGCPAGAPQKN